MAVAYHELSIILLRDSKHILPASLLPERKERESVPGEEEDIKKKTSLKRTPRQNGITYNSERSYGLHDNRHEEDDLFLLWRHLSLW